MRAQPARGTLDLLGLPNVPVAAGTDGGRQGDVDSMEKVDYMGECEGMLGGQQLMVEVLKGAEPRSITLVRSPPECREGRSHAAAPTGRLLAELRARARSRPLLKPACRPRR